MALNLPLSTIQYILLVWESYSRDFTLLSDLIGKIKSGIVLSKSLLICISLLDDSVCSLSSKKFFGAKNHIYLLFTHKSHHHKYLTIYIWMWLFHWNNLSMILETKTMHLTGSWRWMSSNDMTHYKWDMTLSILCWEPMLTFTVLYPYFIYNLPGIAAVIEQISIQSQMNIFTAEKLKVS